MKFVGNGGLSSRFGVPRLRLSSAAGGGGGGTSGGAVAAGVGGGGGKFVVEPGAAGCERWESSSSSSDNSPSSFAGEPRLRLASSEPPQSAPLPSFPGSGDGVLLRELLPLLGFFQSNC